MPKKEESKVPEDKVAKLFRFPPEDVRKLKEAAKRMGVNEATYTLLALRAAFRRDHVE